MPLIIKEQNWNRSKAILWNLVGLGVMHEHWEPTPRKGVEKVMEVTVSKENFKYYKSMALCSHNTINISGAHI